MTYFFIKQDGRRGHPSNFSSDKKRFMRGVVPIRTEPYSVILESLEKCFFREPPGSDLLEAL